MDPAPLRRRLPSESFPLPMPVVAAGAALTVITGAVLASFMLQQGGDPSAPDRDTSAEWLTASAGEGAGLWQTAATPLPAGSMVVSAGLAPSGFAVVVQRGEEAIGNESGMQVAFFGADGEMRRDIRPVLPRSWVLTHAEAVPDGQAVILGQTADGLFLFRVDSDGEPIWGRFEGGGTGAAEGASLVRAGDRVVISVPSPRGLGLNLIAYDLDGRRIWNETLVGIVAGQFALSGTPAGELVLAAAIASGDGETDHRFIRIDPSGTVQADQRLDIPEGQSAQTLGLARDGSAYLVSGGTGASLVRLGPGGSVQWVAELNGMPSDAVSSPDLAVLDDGAVVVSAGPGALRSARVSASGLDVATSLAPLPARLDLLAVGARGNALKVLLSGADGAQPLLVHAAGDARDIFSGRNEPEPLSVPGRTVAVDAPGDAGAPASPPPAMRGTTNADAPARMAEPATRQPVIEDQLPDTLRAAARSGAADADQSGGLRPETGLAEATCEFICMPDGVPAAKYPVTQTYPLGPGQTLNDVTLDAFSEHERLCLASGGLAHAGSVPICRTR